MMLTALIICLTDWCIAATHMAYSKSERMPFYDRYLPLFRDVWHLVGGMRYVCFAYLAWISWGMDWRYYVGTAVLNQVGWMVLKILHGKSNRWGLLPAWLKPSTWR